MSASTPQNYKTLGQAPLDAKLVFINIAAFNTLRQQNPAYAFDFYKGMKVYFQEEEKMYIWENPFSDNYKENHKILDENYIYPIGSAYEDLVYEFKAFNLIELPYRIENLGVWDIDDGDLTVDIDIYEGSTANPFIISDITSLWPDVDRIAFIGGDITGLKLAGQPIALFQEFSINDWDNLSYDIWNNTDGFVQNAKIRIVKEGEVVDYTQYLNKITGNAFKEAGIVHSISDMLHKNSIYFKPTGNTFEIHVVDRLNIRRSFVSQQQGVTDLTLAFSNHTLQILDANNQVITSVPVNISNVNQLQSALDGKLDKPTGNMLAPDLDFKFLVLVDEFGNSRRILASYFSSSGGNINNIVGTVNEIKIVNQGNGVLRVALEDNVVIPNDLTVMGNFIVKGDTTIIETQELKVEDNIITLNSNVLPPQVPVANSGLKISRGVENNVYLIFNETTDRWQFTNDGTIFYNIPIPSEYQNSYYTLATTINALSAVISHPFNTYDVMIQLYNTATGEDIYSFSRRISPSQIQVGANTDYTAPIRVLLHKIG